MAQAENSAKETGLGNYACNTEWFDSLEISITMFMRKLVQGPYQLFQKQVNR
jgi:hypothetical protein